MQRLSRSLTNVKRINAERVNALRKTYESLMDDERRRKDRNEQIIGILDKMRMSNTVALRTPFSRYYDDYQLRNVSPTSHLSDDLRRQKFNETNQTRPLVPAINNINEDIILKEMSKKYIIIPKLRPANINLQCERAFDSTSPITTSNYESEDWKRKYEILNQLKTNNETNDTNPYQMEAERDDKTNNDKLSRNLKFKEESEYSTVAKLVADGKLKQTIDNVSPHNLANDFADLTTSNNETYAENIKTNEQLYQIPFKAKSNQDEVIYANIATANIKPNMSYEQQCTEYRSPDNVAIDPQKPEPRTFDDQEEEVNEIESNLRFTREQSIINNDNIAPESVAQNNENSYYTAELEQCNEKELSPEDLVTNEEKQYDYESSEITLTETQIYEEIPNETNEAKTNEQQIPANQSFEEQPNEHNNPTTSEYQNVNTSETHYQNSDVKHVEEPIYEVEPNVYENYDITNQNNEAPENQYQNYDIQQDGSVDYSNQYQVYDPEQSTVEQAQIDEFNEENNTMFYNETNEEPVFQQPELQQRPEYDQNQYVFDTDNETMQPYDQNYEQQYSGLAYDATQEVPNTTDVGDYAETTYANVTDYGIAENPDQLYVEQVKVEFDTEDGLSVLSEPVT